MMTRTIRMATCLIGLACFAAAQDPTRPWMQGTVEIACSRDGRPWDGDKTAKEWKECGCLHTCLKKGEEGEGDHPEETGGRRWDPQCEARCNTSHCHCGGKCGNT